MDFSGRRVHAKIIFSARRQSKAENDDIVSIRADRNEASGRVDIYTPCAEAYVLVKKRINGKLSRSMPGPDLIGHIVQRRN